MQFSSRLIQHSKITNPRHFAKNSTHFPPFPSSPKPKYFPNTSQKYPTFTFRFKPIQPGNNGTRQSRRILLLKHAVKWKARGRRKPGTFLRAVNRRSRPQELNGSSRSLEIWPLLTPKFFASDPMDRRPRVALDYWWISETSASKVLALLPVARSSLLTLTGSVLPEIRPRWNSLSTSTSRIKNDPLCARQVKNVNADAFRKKYRSKFSVENRLWKVFHSKGNAWMRVLL